MRRLVQPVEAGESNVRDSPAGAARVPRVRVLLLDRGLGRLRTAKRRGELTRLSHPPDPSYGFLWVSLVVLAMPHIPAERKHLLFKSRKVGLLGLEPRTNGLKVRCSNQLSYSPANLLPRLLQWATTCSVGTAASDHWLCQRCQKICS